MKNRRNIYLMYIIALLQGMVFYGPVATLYRQAVGVSIFQITVIESISLALCIVLEVVWGVIADRIGYKKTMIICCVLYFISKIIFWRADGFSGFLLERILLSVVVSGLSGVDTTILYLSVPEEESQSVFGIYNNLGTAGLLFASAVYAVIIKDNYRLAGWLTVISYGLAAVVSLGLKENASLHNLNLRSKMSLHKIKNETMHVFHQMIADRRLLMLLIGAALLSECHQTITVFLNQLKYEYCGMSNMVIGYVYITVTMIGFLGGLSARVTKRIGNVRFGRILYVMCMIACGMLALFDMPWTAVLAVILLRIAFSLFEPLQLNLQNRWVTSDFRATAMSMNALLMNLVAIVTNLIFGRVAEINLSAAFVCGIGFCLAGLVMFNFSTKAMDSK